MPELTQEYLKSILQYNSETGNFIWKTFKSSTAQKDQIAGTVDHFGYIIIGINRKVYKSHRLAFLYINGKLPPNQVDHINCDKADNRWNNLRLCTRSQNQANSGKNINNTSGYKGVHWNKTAKKWVAGIRYQNNYIALGYFDNIKEAATIYNNKAEELFGEFSNLNTID